MQGRSTGIPESIYLLTSSLIMGTKLKTWKYPMSSHVTEQLMDLLWNYLLVVTDNEKRMAWNILLTEEVTERGRQLISGGEEVLRIFLQKILCELKSMFYWRSISWNKYLIHILCTNKKKKVFSSPEPKAQVSFSDQNLSVVRRCRRRHKLFTFSSSSPEPLDQFQPNLAQSILGWRGLKFAQIKGFAFLQGEIIMK